MNVSVYISNLRQLQEIKTCIRIFCLAFMWHEKYKKAFAFVWYFYDGHHTSMMHDAHAVVNA